MEQINIYEGDNVISHILVEDGIQSLEASLEQYAHVYAVMDNNVAMTSAVAAEVADMLNRRGVPGMLLDVSEKTKCMDTVMDICGCLYPVRLTEYPKFTAVNFHSWDICNCALALGKKEKLPVYKFLKEPLIRKFGEEWYAELEAAAEAFYDSDYYKEMKK